jgi:hypothetical protein
MMQRSIRRILWALVRAVSVALVVASPAIAALQEAAVAGQGALINGDMESVGAEGKLEGWHFYPLDVALANGEVEVLTVSPMAAPTESGWTIPCSAVLVGGGSASATLTLTPGLASFDTSSAGTSRLLPGDYRWSVVDGEFRLEGLHVRARLVPAAWDYLLMRRGFRWINEHPFNR